MVTKSVVKLLAQTEKGDKGVQFWRVNSEVCRTEYFAGFDIWGEPMGKRWESTVDHWHTFRQTKPWVIDAPTCGTCWEPVREFGRRECLRHSPTFEVVR